MNRREFTSVLTAAALTPWQRARAAAFPVRFARPNPFDATLRHVEAEGAEKEALALEARLSTPTRRYYALPNNRSFVEDRSFASKPLFRDVTAHVFGSTPSFNRQLLGGNTWWRARLDSACGIDVFGNQGIAVGDIDNDGVDEIYVCQPGGLPNRLYKIIDGQAHDITARASLDILDETTSALFADFRNSGHQDLVVLRGSGPLLFLNRGDGTFREQPEAFHFATPPQGSFTGMAAADYDRDGKLDLYLCCYVYFQSEDQYQYPAPYHDAQNGPPNFLLRNRLGEDGNGRFEDVTAESGMGDNNNRFSFAPAWCDFDGDGWPDLYVANDFGRNNLYRNRNGRFSDEAKKAGVEDMGPGMSASWFDYDGDGRPDLYVSNMWSAAGQRVSADPSFAPTKENQEAYRRHTKGNSLYRNNGDGTFTETAEARMGHWAWGSQGYDFDLDGVPEILVTCGMVTNEWAKDLESFFWRQVVAKTPLDGRPAPEYENGWNGLNQLIREDYSWNGNEPNVFYVRQNGRYENVSPASGVNFADDSRAFAITDFDGDGRPDLILRSRRAPQIRALRNDSSTDRPTIGILLRGTKSNRDAIGARVEVNGVVQYLSAGTGFLSQNSKTLYFGLNGQSKAKIGITWPSGEKQELSGLASGSLWTIVEGSAQPSAKLFRARAVPAEASSLKPRNAPEPADAWLLEPVPAPHKQAGAGLVVLREEDLRREKDDVPAAWALFRRYLFEYRSGLTLPLAILVDAESRARKIYATVPSAETVKGDLARMDRCRELALPFPGRYFQEPRRNYFKLGAAFYWAGYPERALPYLEETLRSRPDNWKALLAIARINQELGHDREAIDIFSRMLALRPDYSPAMVNAGESWMRLNDRGRARDLFERALRADAQCADAANQLGILAAESNDTAGARDWFQKAIAMRRDHSGAINNLAVLYAKQGRGNDAIAAFRYGIQVDPEDEQLYLNLARIYVTMGDREHARAVLNELLDRKPGNTIATRALGELEAR